MDYYEKYLKYKLKYLKLKNINLIGGSLNPNLTVGINFESGKIIEHIIQCSNCVAYANCQIGMDAPYHGRVADENHRSNGRSEKNFPGYREDLLEKQLLLLFSYIKKNYSDKKLIIQIARGRSGIQMYDEVIKNILNLTNYNISSDYIIVYGYRSNDYFKCYNYNEQFVFVNIGMYAVLTDPEKVYVGEICNPIITWNILSYNNSNNIFELEDKTYVFDLDPKNILNNFKEIQKIKLFGINDDMKFVTPDVYNKESINRLVNFANEY
jgi:hypothetical protein